MGRKPTSIAFRADTACAIGVELGPYATSAVLLNMRGKVVASSEEESGAEDYYQMLKNIEEQIRKLMNGRQRQSQCLCNPRSGRILSTEYHILNQYTVPSPGFQQAAPLFVHLPSPLQRTKAQLSYVTNSGGHPSTIKYLPSPISNTSSAFRISSSSAPSRSMPEKT